MLKPVTIGFDDLRAYSGKVNINYNSITKHAQFSYSFAGFLHILYICICERAK